MSKRPDLKTRKSTMQHPRRSEASPKCTKTRAARSLALGMPEPKASGSTPITIAGIAKPPNLRRAGAPTKIGQLCPYCSKTGHKRFAEHVKRCEARQDKARLQQHICCYCKMPFKRANKLLAHQLGCGDPKKRVRRTSIQIAAELEAKKTLEEQGINSDTSDEDGYQKRLRE